MAPEPTPKLVEGVSAAHVSVGAQVTCVTNATGELWCWGDNAYGQLGPNGEGNDFIATPTLVTGLPDLALQPVVGGAHVCALLATNELWCWGGNSSGQLGNGNEIDQTEPVWVPIRGLAGASATNQATCAWTRGGRGYCWGDPAALGDGSDASVSQSSEPIRIGELEDIVQIETGRLVNCARHETGTVSCWGTNDGGQLGLDESTSIGLSPENVPGVAGAQDLAGGGTHMCVRSTDDRAICWGTNELGPLGSRPLESHLAPGDAGAGSSVTEVAGAGGYTCVLRGEEMPMCWGYNDNGQLGRGVSSFMESEPAPVVTPEE